MIGRLLRGAARAASPVIDLGAPLDLAAQDMRSNARAYARMQAERPRNAFFDLGGNHNAPREAAAAYAARQRDIARRSRLDVLSDRPSSSEDLPLPEAPVAELRVLLENALRRRGAATDLMPAQMGALAGASALSIPASLYGFAALDRHERERAKRDLVQTPERLLDEWWNEFRAAEDGFQPFQSRSGVSLDFGPKRGKAVPRSESDPFARLRARTTRESERQKRARRRRDRSADDAWLYDPGPEGWR